MNRLRKLLLFCFVIFYFAHFVRSDCKINVKSGMFQGGGRGYPPILLSMQYTQLYPNDALDPGNVIIGQGGSFYAVCPKNTNNQHKINPSSLPHPERPMSNLFENRNNFHTSYVEIQCNNKQLKLASNGNNVNIARLWCDGGRPMLRNVLNNGFHVSCANGAGIMYEIGYELEVYDRQIPGNRVIFLKTIELCFDPRILQSVWAHATIQPFNQDNTRYPPKDYSFTPGILYSNYFNGKDSPYKKESQITKFKSILGDTVASRFIIPESQYVLDKGHMIARADMFYEAEQRSTYFFGNVMPMWALINRSGNWVTIEKIVRELAFTRRIPLEIYVGWLGTLKHKGKEINLLGTNQIKVPEVLFKCVVDTTYSQALCFIVSNDPYIGVGTPKEVSDRISSLPMYNQRELRLDGYIQKFKDKQFGFTYCVRMKTFVRYTYSTINIEKLQGYQNYPSLL